VLSIHGDEMFVASRACGRRDQAIAMRKRSREQEGGNPETLKS
jgi:hypothetical protein